MDIDKTIKELSQNEIKVLLTLDKLKGKASPENILTNGDFNQEVEVMDLNNSNLESALDSADILVNATSVGMIPNPNQSLVPPELLKPGLVVFDAVYNPLKTKLLTEAENAGALAISGIEMLVWQGALAFELWTGVKAPVDIMKANALKALGDRG